MVRVVLLAILAFIPYLPSLYSEPIFDDNILLNNLWLQKGTKRKYQWRQLSYWTFQLNVWLTGGIGHKQSPIARKRAMGGYHLGGMLLHVLNAFILWWALGMIGIKDSYFAAVIFVVHPLCSQGVAYVSGRFSVLAATFGFLGVGLMGAGHPILATGAVVLACFAKEDSAAFLPLLAVIGHEGWWIPLAALIAGIAWKWRDIGILFADSGGNHLEDAGFPAQLKSPWYQLTAFTEHFIKASQWFLGMGQCADHAVPLLMYRRILPAAAIFLSLIAVSAASPEFGLAFCLFLVPLVPYLLIPMPDPVMEQRLYFSTAGIAVVWSMLPVPPLATVVIVACLALATVCRSWLWRSNLDMWQSVLRDGGRQDRALTNLGCDCLEAEKFAESKDYCERALELNPNLGIARNNLAMCEWKTGNVDRALFHAAESTRRCPRFFQGYFLYGRIAEDAGKPDDAAIAYEQCVALKAFPVAHNRLGMIWILRNNLAEAARHFAKAVAEDPNTVTYGYNNAVILELTGAREESIAQWKKLPRQIPVNDDMVILQRMEA